MSGASVIWVNAIIGAVLFDAIAAAAIGGVIWHKLSSRFHEDHRLSNTDEAHVQLERIHSATRIWYPARVNVLNPPVRGGDEAVAGKPAVRSAESDFGAPGPSRRPVAMALLLIAGMTIGHNAAGIRAESWIIAGAVALIVWAAWRMAPSAAFARLAAALAMALALLFTAAARMAIHADYVSDHDIATHVTEREELWRLEGRVRTRPVVKTSSGGSMSRFGYQEPSTYFQFAVERAIGVRGDANGAQETLELTGAVLVRINEPDYRLRVGDRLRVVGMLVKFPPARNPGELDRERLARTQGLAGTLEVKTRGNLHFLQQDRDFLWRWRRFRARINERAAGWLLQDLPPSDSSQRDALLSALLLGDRGLALDGLDKAFQRVGLAHLLSISGLHLAVLIWTAALLLRVLSPSHHVEKILLIALIVGYLFVLPGRIPVWRSAVMAISFYLAALTGRRIEGLNVLAWATLILLWWKPSELTTAGFQLSFGVVLALLLLTHPAQRMMFGEHRDIERLSIPEMAVERLKSILAAAVVAWAISLPLVAHHFGVVCPTAWAVSLLAAPFVTIALVAGYIKAMTALLFPSVGVIAAPFLTLASDGLIGLIVRLDEFSWSSISVDQPGVVWTALATCAIAWMLIARPIRFHLPVKLAVAAALTLTLVAPRVIARYRPNRPALEITMFAVGDGSCYLLESDGEAALFDAGSGGHFAIGDTMIVPSLRRLGAPRRPTMIVSHADLDHFAATIEIVEQFGARELIVSPHMIAQARAEPMSPIGVLLSEIEKRGVSVREATRGHSITLGAASLTWLNPERGRAYEIDNDSSAVIRIEAAGRAILFTGDIQADTIERLMSIDADSLSADIMELPHHGSWSDEAVELVKGVDPEIVLQSTGWSRLKEDRWVAPLEGRRRFVSARDGMTTVTIGRDGSIECETWLDRNRSPER